MPTSSSSLTGFRALLWALLPASLAATQSACIVSRADYEACINDANTTRADAAAKQKAAAAQIADLQQRLSAAEAATQDRDGKLSELSTANHNLQAELDEATAMNQQLRGELSRLGRDVDKVLADRGTLAKALDDAKTRLEELRKAQQAAEEQAQVFRDFAQRFRPLVDAGQLRVESRRGRLVMNVTGDLLFDEGRADVRTAGKGALMEIARAMTAPASTKAGRRFLVTGHVDDAPIKGRHFKSSWELTAARAVAVVEYLVSLHVSPEALTAAGAGSFDPIAPNDSTEDRAKNRRIEIALLPAESEVVTPVQQAAK